MCKYDVISRPEVHNVSQRRRQRRTEPRSWVTCRKHLVKIGRVVCSGICSWTNTNTQTEDSLSLRQILCLYPMAVARSFSGRIAIFYLLPFLCMMSHFSIMGPMAVAFRPRQRRLNSITCTFIAACLKCRHDCLCGARCILFALVCRCRCHPEAPSSLASLKPRIFTQVVLEERHFVFSSSVKRPARPRQRCGLSPNYYGSFAVNSRALLFRTVRTFSPVAVSLDI